MLVISDASTLILLQKIGLLERLTNRFRFAITPQVCIEVVEKGKAKNAPDAYAIERKIANGEVTASKPEDSGLIKEIMLKFGTQLGETETIALWIERKKGIVAVDDHKAMLVCNAYGVPFTTALTLVVASKNSGVILLNEAKKMIAQLCIYGRYKDELVNEALKLLEGEAND